MTVREPAPSPVDGTIRPRRLRIGIVAPSGPVESETLDAGVARLRARGHQVRLAPHVRDQWRAFAGEDEARLADLRSFAADPQLDVIMAARGGYGWSRLLHRIDWPGMAACGKTFVGFSDFTAFSLAALHHGLPSLAGPMAAVEFAGPEDEDLAYVETHFWPLLEGATLSVGPVADTAASARAEPLTGMLWGTNLTLLTHLVGTPYLPAVPEGILVLEDVAVPPYALERMLWQLWHAGILAAQRAVILGSFSGCHPLPGRYPYALDEMIETFRRLLPRPLLTGFPFGHTRRKCSVPIGGQGRLFLADGSYRLELSPAAAHRMPSPD